MTWRPRPPVGILAALLVVLLVAGAWPVVPSHATAWSGPGDDGEVPSGPVDAVVIPEADVPRFGRPVYRNVTDAAGLGDFLHAGWLGPGNDDEQPAVFIEAMGPGACWLDADGDGWLDLYLINGRYHTHKEKNALLDPHSQLYRNLGDGTFEDVTDASGTRLVGDHQGCAAADVDNDGDADLFVTGWGGNVLFQNQGDGTFIDIARDSDARMERCTGFPCWSTSVSFLDMDIDGCLDLYINHFEEADPDDPPDQNGPGPGQRDRLLRGDCTGQFTNITGPAGLYDHKKNTWSTVAADLDEDGDTDIYASNDGDPNDIWLNQGDGTFVRKENSTANDIWSGMGTAVADFDRNGRPDIVTTNWHVQYNGVYQAEGDDYVQLGEAAPFTDSYDHSGWATHWSDFNHDGQLDLMVVNGNTEDLGGFPVYQPLLAYDQMEDGRFVSSRDDLGADFLQLLVGRGAAWADYDDDGDLDMQVSEAGEHPTHLFRADDVPGNFLTVRLVGTGAHMTRDAVGSKVTVWSDHVAPQTLEKVIGSGYLSSNDPRLHFGLASDEVVQIRVDWMDGTSETFENVRANSFIRIEQHVGLTVLKDVPIVRVDGPTENLGRLAAATFRMDVVPATDGAPIVARWWTMPDGTRLDGATVTARFPEVGWQAIKAHAEDAQGRVKTQGFRVLVVDELQASVLAERVRYGPHELPHVEATVRYSNGDPVSGADVSLVVRHRYAEEAFGPGATDAPGGSERILGWIPQHLEAVTGHDGTARIVIPANVAPLGEGSFANASQVGKYTVDATVDVRGLEVTAPQAWYLVAA